MLKFRWMQTLLFVVIAAPVVTAAVKSAGESLVIESTLRALSIATSTSWALGCDSETEQK